MGCPNEDCRENLVNKLTGHDKTLYGTDGRGGVTRDVGDIKKELDTKVSRKGVTSVALGMVATAVTLVIVILSAWGSAKDERVQNSKEISTLRERQEQQYVAIRDDIKDLKTAQDEMVKKQIDPDKFLLEIGKIVEEKIK